MSLREHVSLREHACVSSRGAQSTELVSLYTGYWTLNNYYYYLLFLFLCYVVFSDNLLAAHGVTSADGPHNDKASNLIAQFRTFSDVLKRFQTLRVDATEYACLKALVLFKSGT